MPDSEDGSGRLVGRADELALLRAAVQIAAAGRGSAVLVAGEAGIGKTRLVAELSAEARAAGGPVLTGRCLDQIGPGAPYFALREAFRPVAGPAAWQSGADGQPRLFDELRAGLDALASAGPVLLVLEDLHWADGSTLDFVAYLCRIIGERRVVFVGTYRDDEIRPGDPLSRAVVELVRAREARVVELAPLDPADLRALLADAATRELPADLVEAIVARAGGNPFFAEELLAAADRGERALPAILRDALLQRVSRVGPAGREVLRVAAAFGRDVPHRLLVRLASVPERELVGVLRETVDEGVLVPDRAAASYRFRHALLAEAVYHTILPGEAEWLHARLARALVADPGLGGAGEVARHWDAAGDQAEALEASVRAAREAEAGCGLAVAHRHLERALELWPGVPAAAQLTGLDLPAVLAWTAELADLTGHGPRAADLVRQAIELVDPLTDPVRAGVLHGRLGSYLLPTGDRGEALAVCTRAAELVPARPPSAERVRVLTTLGNALMLSWRHAESRAVCEGALAVAESIGDARPAVRAMAIHGLDLLYLGHPQAARERTLAARERALECGSPRDIVHCHALLCEVLIVSGEPHEAGRYAVDGLALAHRLGAGRSFGALLAAYAAEAGLETGDWARAGDLLAEALRHGSPFWAHYPRLLQAQLATARGDFAAARQHIAAGAPGGRQPTSAARYARVVAELALWEGRPDEAASAVEAGLRGSAATRGTGQGARLATLGVRAQVERSQLAAVRREESTVDAARRRARYLLGAARRSATAAVAVTPEATAWRTLAEAEYGRLDGAGDPETWRAATDAWDALGRPYPAAYTRWRLVEALLATGLPELRGDAVRAAREAHRAATDLGAAPLRHELEELARRTRLDLVGLPAKPAERVDTLGLTARESQVLTLLTRGYTNREIATELTISVKTASVHVTHIMRKLGVSSRLDAAAIGHRMGCR